MCIYIYQFFLYVPICISQYIYYFYRKPHKVGAPVSPLHHTARDNISACSGLTLLGTVKCILTALIDVRGDVNSCVVVGYEAFKGWVLLEPWIDSVLPALCFVHVKLLVRAVLVLDAI